MLSAKGVVLLGLIALALPALPAAGARGLANTGSALDPASLTKYVDELPIPATARPVAPGSYELFLKQSSVKMHRDLPPTAVWGYTDTAAAAGGYLGPTFVVRTGEEIHVRWTNDLPETHLLASSIDDSLPGMLDPDGDALQQVRTVTHLHGGHTDPASDGGPDGWQPDPDDATEGGLPGQSIVDDYPNDQDATLLWYHDHALGITRLNPYAGLAGAYIIRDAWEDALGLPGNATDAPGTAGSRTQGFELPLVLQDKSFTVDRAANTSSLAYPPAPWVPEFFGDTIVVNGKIWPFLNVEPRKYRFRILNGSNARFYALSFHAPNAPAASTPTIYQIGAEGGLLPQVAPTQQLLIAPGERADVIVDFSHNAGATLLLRNTAKAPYPNGTPPNPQTVGQIMQFRVGTVLSHPDTTVIPAVPRPRAEVSLTRKLDPAHAVTVRDVKMREVVDANGFPVRLQLEDKGWMDPVTLTPTVGTAEIWRLINTTGDTHPMHLHLVQFQVLDRQKFNVAKYLASGNVLDPTLLGQPKGPRANETGLKDTVQVDPGEVVRIIAYFDHVGMYPIHCHILEHEENEMMRPFEVLPNP